MLTAYTTVSSFVWFKQVSINRKAQHLKPSRFTGRQWHPRALLSLLTETFASDGNITYTCSVDGGRTVVWEVRGRQIIGQDLMFAESGFFVQGLATIKHLCHQNIGGGETECLTERPSWSQPPLCCCGGFDRHSRDKILHHHLWWVHSLCLSCMPYYCHGS